MTRRVIIMDEPTTSLTEVEIERVFAYDAHGAAHEGVSIVFISHKLREVLDHLRFLHGAARRRERGAAGRHPRDGSGPSASWRDTWWGTR